MEFLNVKKIKDLLCPYLTPRGFGVCWLQIVFSQMPPLLPPCLSLSSIQMVCLRRDNYWSRLTYREHIVRNTLGLVLASSLKVLVGSCGLKQTLSKSLTLHCCAPSIITWSKQSQSTPSCRIFSEERGKENVHFVLIPTEQSRWAKSFMFGAGRMESWENGQNLKSSICRKETRTALGLRMTRKIPVSSLNDFVLALFF